MTDEDFSRLLGRAQGGDGQAWKEIFSRLADPGAEGAQLLQIARQILPPGDRARDFVESTDLLQSALKSGWLDASQFRGGSPGEFLGWMRTILRRKLGRVVRRRDPRPAGEPLEEAAGLPPSGEESRLAALVREEVKLRVQAAVADLPEEQRVVVEMRLQGLKSPDIAAVLGLSPEAVRKRESRAAERLRLLLHRES
jgi:RNA polymerase sigma factor (sigma-70 family)